MLCISFVAIVLFLATVNGTAVDISVDGRIVGGKPTSIDKVPYQVGLILNGIPFCSGSIVSKLHIVTAGHCTK